MKACHTKFVFNISELCVNYIMTKKQNKQVQQINKNNKTKPENLMKKEYDESYKELKQNIKDEQKD